MLGLLSTADGFVMNRAAAGAVKCHRRAEMAADIYEHGKQFSIYSSETATAFTCEFRAAECGETLPILRNLLQVYACAALNNENKQCVNYVTASHRNCDRYCAAWDLNAADCRHDWDKWLDTVEHQHAAADVADALKKSSR